MNYMISQELIELCKKNKAHAQSELYRIYKTKLMGVCRRYTYSREEAQDVLQEAFFKILTKIKQVESNEKLEAWMIKVTVRTAINHYHSNVKRLNTIKLEEFDSVVDDEEIILSRLSGEAVLDAINQLPDGARIIFSLFAIDGYSHTEIAEMLDISEGTSRSQFYYAKTLLKSKLKKLEVVIHEKYAT